ncbi:hypothetical protein SLEP1_g60270, partial [Rubroshorea leprosula]
MADGLFTLIVHQIELKTAPA